jgi:hypothetical protein
LVRSLQDIVCLLKIPRPDPVSFDPVSFKKAGLKKVGLKKVGIGLEEFCFSIVALDNSPKPDPVSCLAATYSSATIFCL